MMRSNRPRAATAARKSCASHTPCERPFLVFAWSARGVRFASRCGGAQSIRSHYCARFMKPRAMMRPNR
eukprot:2354896-Lingulodinium_polyedra.AAC.1